jgi:glycine/D-amino acid oxidase-like deaminating enzyme
MWSAVPDTDGDLQLLTDSLLLLMSHSVLQGVAGSLASCLSDAAAEAEQACYLPLSSDGLPVIGR